MKKLPANPDYDIDEIVGRMLEVRESDVLIEALLSDGPDNASLGELCRTTNVQDLVEKLLEENGS